MSTNYIDTLTMFYGCKFDIRPLFKTHWVYDTRDKDANLHNYCIKTRYCIVRYFPNMYGFRRLYVTFSLPKMYHQCNDNTFNVTDYDNQTFMQRLENELAQVLDTATLPTALSEWQPSRIDLFRMRRINPADRMEYHNGYGCIYYRGHFSTTVFNTNYLTSSQLAKHPCILTRMYNKTKEKSDRAIIKMGGIPPMIEDEQDSLMEDVDMPVEQYRYEFASTRPAIKRQIDKFNRPLNMETIMDEDIQKRWLNDLVYSRGLYCHIYAKKEFHDVVDKLFRTQHTKDNALKLAEAIRNRKPLPLSKSQRYRIIKELRGGGISIATTKFISIRGLDFL